MRRLISLTRLIVYLSIHLSISIVHYLLHQLTDKICLQNKFKEFTMSLKLDKCAVTGMKADVTSRLPTPWKGRYINSCT